MDRPDQKVVIGREMDLGLKVKDRLCQRWVYIKMVARTPYEGSQAWLKLG